MVQSIGAVLGAVLVFSGGRSQDGAVSGRVSKSSETASVNQDPEWPPHPSKTGCQGPGVPPLPLGPPERLCIQSRRPGGCSRASVRQGEYEARQRKGLLGKSRGPERERLRRGHEWWRQLVLAGLPPGRS
ncbi:hypothetical protein NDU88_001768 [Pleurodeles waltl]|uniref:Uncharacterized protein n=1 Tax=Pleurodeles waltl TaxID=8319 RepID=A0AAV7VBC5_PLEWA|nr:hypothetical protein NDU88_001768 [Pleurodeles waltl]